MRKNKPVDYTKISPSQQTWVLRDMATAIEYGSLPSDQRLQVKMPAIVVSYLDELFPTIDRSRLLTTLALDAILRKLRYQDNEDLGDLIAGEQESLDELSDYLAEREKEV